MALTTLANLKLMLQIAAADTSEDDRLNLLITAASDIIEEYLGRTVASATYTEYYSGNGTQYLVLRQRPVTSVTSVHEALSGYFAQGSEAYDSTTILTAGTDYVLNYSSGTTESRSGLLIRLNATWQRSQRHIRGLLGSSWMPYYGAIKVIYVAGYSSTPTPIARACDILISRLRNMFPHGRPFNSENYEEYGYSLAQAGQSKFGLLAGEPAWLLGPYKNRPWGYL